MIIILGILMGAICGLFAFVGVGLVVSVFNQCWCTYKEKKRKKRIVSAYSDKELMELQERMEADPYGTEIMCRDDIDAAYVGAVRKAVRKRGIKSLRQYGYSYC